MTSKYISLKSILYDISLSIDDRFINENTFLEWAARGLRQLNISPLLEDKTEILTVIDHKATLPSDLRYLIQIAYYIPSVNPTNDLSELDLPPTSTWELGYSASIQWAPMRLTTNPYHSSICLPNSIPNCTDCSYEFSVSPSGTITTTLKEGTIMVAYKAYISEDNDLLIPDDETLKEALMHYIYYRYWMSRSFSGEANTIQLMREHRAMWSTLATKTAGKLNSPDVNELENLKNIHNTIVPRENKFEQLFLTLGNKENTTYV